MGRGFVRDFSHWTPWAVFGLALALYIATLAPTVLWGDDAGLQRQAALLELRGGVLGHPLWTLLAHVLMGLPFGDLAWRANLLSALAGAGTLPLTYALARREGASPWGGAAAAGMLGLAHTFWLHAVRAEVYTLLLLFWAAGILCLVRWEADRQEKWLELGGFLGVVGLANHLLLIGLVPGAAWWLWAHRARLTRRGMALLLAGAALGAIPLVVWLWCVPGEQVYAPLPQVLAGLLRPEAWRIGWKDLALALGYGAYQFPLTGLLALPGLASLARRDWRRATAWGLWLAAPAAFALRHRVPDQYAFFLPAYLSVAIWCGLGYDAVGRWLRRGVAARVLLLALCLGLPVLTYRLAPVALTRCPVLPLEVREIPGRDPLRFFLWPPKQGEWGARAFGESALRAVPAGALILADWTLQAPLEYLQDVEGLRPDVVVVGTGDLARPQKEFLQGECRDRPCYLADVNRYYDLAAIEQGFTIQPVGVLYRLVPRQG